MGYRLRRRTRSVPPLPPSLLTPKRNAGTESGGHGPTTSVGLPLLSLLPLLLPHYSTPTSPLLLPAGGLTTGTHLASLLSFSPGIILGTAFLLTPEATFLPAQKELLRRSSGEDTVRTGRFDEARGTLGWGEGVDGRGVRNETSERVGGGGREGYEEAVRVGDVRRIVTWAGECFFVGGWGRELMRGRRNGSWVV